MGRSAASLLIVSAHAADFVWRAAGPRNSSANLGHKTSVKGEAYQRVFPTIATELS
jgi:hypothetical protein